MHAPKRDHGQQSIAAPLPGQSVAFRHHSSCSRLVLLHGADEWSVLVAIVKQLALSRLAVGMPPGGWHTSAACRARVVTAAAVTHPPFYGRCSAKLFVLPSL